MAYSTTIIAKKDLYNNGKCFTKGQEYVIERRDIHTEAGLMEAETINDQGEKALHWFMVERIQNSKIIFNKSIK